MQETLETHVSSRGKEDPLEKGMATHPNILAWRILWTEEPGGTQSVGSHRVRLSYDCYWCMDEAGQVGGESLGQGVKKTRIILVTCLLDDLGKITLIISSDQPLICQAKALSNGSNGNNICYKL